MKLAIFIDGKNFYSGWRDEAAGARIDWPRLTTWLVGRTGATVLTGCHYYTGIETGTNANQEGQKKLESFLSMLELQPGYFVYRFPRKARSYSCAGCGAMNRFTQEKEVDTTMVADMLRLAAVGAFDVMVLISGDSDHAPAVDGVRMLGKIVYVATWRGSGLSARLRKAAFDHIDLLTGSTTFATPHDAPGPASPPADAALPPSPAAPPVAPVLPMPIEAVQLATAAAPIAQASKTPKEVFLQQLGVAEERFQGAYVGASMFLTRWRAPDFDMISGFEKQRLLNELLKAEAVEIYEVEGKKAIRRKRT